MERTIYLQHYRVCLRTDGTPQEVSRDGAAITYEAVDERTRDPVDLKLIPLESIESGIREKLDEQARAAQMLRHVNVAKVYDFGREGGDFVCVSEHLPGETLAAWVAAHGPMPADAALRVAEQVVSVLSSASFHRLPYPPIELSDIVIVPGQTPEGTWPLVKLINFGLPTFRSGAGPEAEDSQTREQASSAEQSAKQIAYETRDIRPEVYSLGATLYLLLTGGSLSPEELQRPLKFSKFPKPLRALLARMLHTDPNQRPKDLVVLAEMIRQCLLKIERRRALADKYGIPYRITMPRRTKAPPKRFLRVAIPVAAMLLAAAVIAAFLLPGPLGKIVSRAGETKPVGVLIGVPESSARSAAQNASTADAKASGPAVASQRDNAALSQPTANAAPASTTSQVPSPDLQQAQTSNAKSQGAAQNTSEASSPVALPESSPAPGGETTLSSKAEEASQPGGTGEAASRSKSKRITSTVQSRGALAHAQMVGITSDGRLIYRLPSGRTRIVAPDSDQGEFVPRRHRRIFIDRDEVFAPRPRFAPDYLPDD